MSKRELVESAIELNLPYRDILDINQGEDIGVEIETEGLLKSDVSSLLKKYNDFFTTTIDHSLISGAEFVSVPFYNERETWELLCNFSNDLKNYPASFDRSSFQINLGNRYDYKKLLLFLELFSVYEKVIYRFSMGRDENLRYSIDEYATPISSLYRDVLVAYDDDEYKIKIFSNNKCYALSLKSHGLFLDERGIKLVEFRTPNGTNDAWLWQNYINFFYHLFNSLNNPNCDFDRIDYLFKKIPLGYLASFDCYERLNIEKALELADLIFVNEKDKLYFLKQYINDLIKPEDVKKILK